MKKHMKKMLGIGTNVVAGSLVMGALPSNAVTTNVTAGYANFSKAFPAVGTIMGTGLVIKSTKKLFKPLKKLK